MQARFEKIPHDHRRSYRVSERRLAAFDAPWHFHPEIELTLIVSGRGRRFVGDSLERFEAGDLALLGSNLPHFWKSDADTPPCHSIVVQFNRDFLGEPFLNVAETAGINRLLQRAARGLVFLPHKRIEEVRQALLDLPRQKGLAGLTALLSILDRLAHDRGARVLSASDPILTLDRGAESRLARVFDCITTHFSEELTLGELASRAAMTPAAFSRFFKRTTGRAPSDFVNDVRVEHACRLLRETDRTVADIAGAAGFTTLTNFNRRFRERLHTAPRDYRRPFRMPAGTL